MNALVGTSLGSGPIYAKIGQVSSFKDLPVYYLANLADVNKNLNYIDQYVLTWSATSNTFILSPQEGGSNSTLGFIIGSNPNTGILINNALSVNVTNDMTLVITANNATTTQEGIVQLSDNLANNANYLATSANTVSVVYNIANFAFATANSTLLQAQNAYNQANVAFSKANIAFNVGNSSYFQANASNNMAQGAYNEANVAFSQANAALILATSANNVGTFAFIEANAAFIQANASFLEANNAFIEAQHSYLNSNAAYVQANAAFVVANAAFVEAQSAFVQSNTSNILAQNAFNKANTIINYVPLSGNVNITGNISFQNTFSYALQTVNVPWDFLVTYGDQVNADVTFLHVDNNANNSNSSAFSTHGIYNEFSVNDINPVFSSAFTSALFNNVSGDSGAVGQAGWFAYVISPELYSGDGGALFVTVVNNSPNTSTSRALGISSYGPYPGSDGISFYNLSGPEPGGYFYNGIFFNQTRGGSIANAFFTDSGSNTTPVQIQYGSFFDGSSQFNIAEYRGPGFEIGPTTNNYNSKITVQSSNSGNPLIIPVGNGNTPATSANIVISGLSSGKIILSSNTILNNVDIFNYTQSAYNASNASFLEANSAFIEAQASFINANAAYVQANAAFMVANIATNNASFAYAQANAAFIQANAAFVRANTVDGISQITFLTTNGLTVNSVSNTTITSNNTLILSANDASTTQIGVVQLNDVVSNSSTTLAADANTVSVVYNIANFSFTQANAAFIQANAAFAKANTASSTAIELFQGVEQANVVATFAYGQANSAFIQANNANTLASNALPLTGGTLTGQLQVNGSIIANTINISGNVIANTVRSSYSTQSTITGNYTLQPTDSGTVIICNNTANANVYVPAVLGAGFRCVITQVNTGNVFIYANSTNIFQTNGANNMISIKYGSASIYCFSTNNYILDGAVT
jgi:Phage tail fibre repeat